MTTTTTTHLTAPCAQPPTTIHLRIQTNPTPTMADDSAPPDQASDMPAATETLTCKACGRTLASISTEGDLRPHGALAEGCALCKDMMMHCNEYEEVKGYFKELEHRRDDYRPRQLALEVVHQAQMHLGNFIHEVVAQGTSDDEAPGVLSEPQPGEQIETETPPVEVADAPPRRRKRSLSPQSLPGARKRTKRPRLSELARRVTFDPSVVFRDAEAVEKRVDAEFSRNSDGYSPGRYAAPEGSEWLDTSGSSLKETQFFGVQKRGKKWVPTKEGLEMDEEWESAGQAGDIAGGETGGSEGMAAIEEADADQADRQDSQMDGLIRES
jgi:hypothetical protein